LDKVWGREQELEKLQMLQKKSKSSLVVIRGRRRIGKSTLARHFGKKFGHHFIEISGLAPTPKQTNQEQLDEFLYQLKKQLPTRRDKFSDWREAFDELYFHLKKRRRVVILFDEVSWMGGLEPNFAGQLKNLWDLHLKDHPSLIFILCGSVSTWIQENILNSTHFVGRVSADFVLGELPLRTVAKFWGPWDNKVSDLEKLRLLSVTGLVPKYLEEIQVSQSANENINRLCFQSDGFLHNEFDKIFNDVFDRRAKTFKKIIHHLVSQNLTAAKIANKLNLELSSSLIEYLENLEISGFLNRDYSFPIGQEKSKTSAFRIKDNYLRFALKYLEPRKVSGKGFTSKTSGLEQLPQWLTISGLQFENTVLNHLDEIVEKLNIPISQVLTASPHRQAAKTRNRGACQVDLLIQTAEKTAYVCEIKLRNEINRQVIREVEKKIHVLERPRNWSVRPVLIYEGHISTNDQVEIGQYFAKTLKIGDLLREP
jgi:AAA+ ATPase superfamily predicted ATPase